MNVEDSIKRRRGKKVWRLVTDDLTKAVPTESTPSSDVNLANDKDIQELEKVCRPVVEFLQKRYGSPHHRVLIDWASAVLLEDLKGVGFNVPD